MSCHTYDVASPFMWGQESLGGVPSNTILSLLMRRLEQHWSIVPIASSTRKRYNILGSHRVDISVYFTCHHSQNDNSRQEVFCHIHPEARYTAWCQVCAECSDRMSMSMIAVSSRNGLQPDAFQLDLPAVVFSHDMFSIWTFSSHSDYGTMIHGSYFSDLCAQLQLHFRQQHGHKPRALDQFILDNWSKCYPFLPVTSRNKGVLPPSGIGGLPLYIVDSSSLPADMTCFHYKMRLTFHTDENIQTVMYPRMNFHVANVRLNEWGWVFDLVHGLWTDHIRLWNRNHAGP